MKKDNNIVAFVLVFIVILILVQLIFLSRKPSQANSLQLPLQETLARLPSR